MHHIFVDADACPVKNEVYRVAGRHGLKVTLVSNSRMRIPEEPWIQLQVVGAGLDVADDWIVTHAGRGDLVITGDIPLASRLIENDVRVLGTTGRAFTEDNIGDTVATRDLLAGLREAGEITSGPSPLNNKDRSRFLQKLDEMAVSLKREFK